MKHWRRHSRPVIRSRLFGSPDAECIFGQRRPFYGRETKRFTRATDEKPAAMPIT